MAKKSSMSLVFGIGMLIAAIGFCLPMFQFKFFGTHSYNGWSFVGDGDTTAKIFMILVFAGAALGAVAAFLPLPQKDLLKVIGLALSIVSFIVVIIMMMNSDSVQFIKGVNLGKKVASKILQSMTYGSYMLFGGWIISIVGLALKK